MREKRQQRGDESVMLKSPYSTDEKHEKTKTLQIAKQGVASDETQDKRNKLEDGRVRREVNNEREQTRRW